jgi:hypothetical protein
MKRNDGASNQLDTITPRTWRALDCEHSPHRYARDVVPSGAHREDQHEDYTGVHLIAFRTSDQARARTACKAIHGCDVCREPFDEFKAF